MTLDKILPLTIPEERAHDMVERGHADFLFGGMRTHIAIYNTAYIHLGECYYRVPKGNDPINPLQ